jgi:hypothetical protein
VIISGGGCEQRKRSRGIWVGGLARSRSEQSLLVPDDAEGFCVRLNLHLLLVGQLSDARGVGEYLVVGHFGERIRAVRDALAK